VQIGGLVNIPNNKTYTASKAVFFCLNFKGRKSPFVATKQGARSVRMKKH